MTRRRLDAELVRRHLARSRELAREVIESGGVKVAGIVSTKPSRQVTDSDPITVAQTVQAQWVSRGSGKLIGALEAFPELRVDDRICLDAGASTGGFTAILLERGARHVYAVDVGYGQLAWSVSQDPRVTVMDRTNVRAVTADQFPVRPGLVTADLSFISLRTVLPALATVADIEADFLLMVKPQFEVGKSKLGKGGVVRNLEDRAQAVRNVGQTGFDLGLGCLGVAASPLPGPSGNVEYFVWLRCGGPAMREDDVDRAIASGPE